jgi:hypothetical protein
MDYMWEVAHAHRRSSLLSVRFQIPVDVSDVLNAICEELSVPIFTLLIRAFKQKARA